MLGYTPVLSLGLGLGLNFDINSSPRLDPAPGLDNRVTYYNASIIVIICTRSMIVESPARSFAQSHAPSACPLCQHVRVLPCFPKYLFHLRIECPVFLTPPTAIWKYHPPQLIDPRNQWLV